MALNILHVIDTTGPGGAETVFLDLAQETMRRGHKSIALIRGPGWVQDQLKKRGIAYEVCDCKGSLNVRFLVFLVSVIRRHGITHIQSHLLGSNVYTSLVGLLLRIPVVNTFHGHVDISKKERFRNIKLAIVRAGARHVVSVTDELKHSINRTTRGWSHLNAAVIPNGIDVTKLEKLPIKPFDENSGRMVFGCLGNIRPAKNYSLAVEFIALLQRKGVDVELRVAGDDTKPEAQALKEYALTCGVGKKVQFLGFIDDVCAFLSDIDVFLMTSSSEGHPLALTQALAAGLPVISTRNGVEKIVPEEFMFLAHDQTPESLEVARTKLLITEDLNKIRVKARVYVLNHYSLDSMFSRYFQLYEV
ncbi:glycosyltransferase family 4 protein [Marinobacter salarius]|uniref:glycosyltransferase family 4 protein n=1 Tax=Marinobacter salarius TaxID=1420917 RepID=UPI000F8587E2|nr:glycosyltransferase family 4 protein [Marinobacter salarius]AZR42803.1 hypothetical protein MTMN5_03368 [Marinobacter salarius]